MRKSMLATSWSSGVSGQSHSSGTADWAAAQLKIRTFLLRAVVLAGLRIVGSGREC